MALCLSVTHHDEYTEARGRSVDLTHGPGRRIYEALGSRAAPGGSRVDKHALVKMSFST
jgi:hypothetical protein